MKKGEEEKQNLEKIISSLGKCHVAKKDEIIPDRVAVIMVFGSNLHLK